MSKVKYKMPEAEVVAERFCTEVGPGNIPGSGADVLSGGRKMRDVTRCACATLGNSNLTGGAVRE